MIRVPPRVESLPWSPPHGQCGQDTAHPLHRNPVLADWSCRRSVARTKRDCQHQFDRWIVARGSAYQLPFDGMDPIPRSASGQLTRFKSKETIEAERKRINEKRAKAASIVFRNIVEKKDLATAYSEVFPESTATRKQKKKQAGKLVKWFRLNFPIHIRRLLYLKGYNDDFIVDELGKQLQATMPLKKRTRKFKETNDQGETIQVEEIDYIDIPDYRVRGDALQKFIVLAGHHARRAHVPTPEEARRSAPRDATQPPPMRIVTREKLPPDEWQKKYQQTIAESNASGKAEQMLRDLERRVAEAEEANGEVTHRPPGLPFDRHTR